MATLRGPIGLFIRPTIGGCFDRFSPWRKGEISGGGSSPGHIGTPTNCYRPMIDMFDRAVAKYMGGESDEKV